MYYQDLAIILKRKDFKDNDSLITCYTAKHGKLILRAIGAKKILSKLSAHLEPMNLSELNWVAGKGGEKLTGADAVQTFKNIRENYDKLIFAQYFLDIIDKAIKIHHADPKIFVFLKSVLEKLNAVDVDNDKKVLYLIKLAFDYKLLWLLGHSAEYRHELSVEEKSAIKKIVNLKIDEIIKLNLDKKILNSLYKKSQMFWEEVVEERIKNIEI